MNAAIELDDTDERIVELLRSDGRMPYRTIAAELGMTEATVRTRIRRMEHNDAMRVVAVADFQAAGYEMMLAVGIAVDGRAPLEVAEQLAEFPEVFSINVVIGSCDIETLVVAEDQAAMADLIYRRFAELPGVLRVSPSLAVNVLKNQPDSVPFYKTAEDALYKTASDPATSGSGDATSPSSSVKAGASLSSNGGHSVKRLLDGVDREIVARLGRDARTSNRRIADEIGVTEGTVRSRIKRMQEEKQIRITAVTNIDRYRGAAIAYVWVEVERSDRAEQVAQQMAAMKEFGFVGLMMGRYDILGITMVRNTEHLARFVHKHVSSLEGVRSTESSLGVNFVKHDYRMSRIVG
ncbi:MAG: Lrp/AsnC family transcriptional regulator [Halieaceae bacterium]|nr:Lrp/AsnC family transcriptional regulator [Halieaceae bacterium]